MSAKKPAAPKNQLGLFASMDTEIASEKHDDIMLWTDRHAVEIITALFPHITGPTWSLFSNQWDIQHDPCKSPPGLLPDVEYPKLEWYLVEKAWERPLMDYPRNVKDKRNVVGFIDLFVQINYPTLLDGGYFETTPLKDKVSYMKANFFFEIKTTIKLGELIRQINYYKTYTDSINEKPYYIVVSPDARYKETLNEQAIYFVEYPIIPN
jgi:hypothetical protein